MAKIARLTGCSDWIDLDFVERERTPRRLMKLSIHLHAASATLVVHPLRVEKDNEGVRGRVS